jgi:threonine aldolase
MRQVGILAAAGIVAVETMIDRLAEDHAKARYIAEEIAKLPGISVDLRSVQTNMVYFNVVNAASFAAGMKEHGVLCNVLYGDAIRLVTHYEISNENAKDAVNVIARLVEKRQAVVA